jgi:RNA polymerase sigma factor for flagellar operon FliA
LFVTTSERTRAPRPVDTEKERQLVSEHLPLVGYIVSELIGRVPPHVSKDELTSAGLAALAQAARGFDPERGVPFGKFAGTRIRGGILDELRSMDWASRSVRTRARKIDTVREQLIAALGRVPTASELATASGVTVAELNSVTDDIQRAVVLSMQGFADPNALEEMAVAHTPSPEENLLLRERLGYLHAAVDSLPDRLRTVVIGYFLHERPMAEIAEELGVTESRVSQLRAEALVLLKDGMNSQLDPAQVTAADRPDGKVTRRREAYFAAVAAHSDLRTRLSVRTDEVPFAIRHSA